MGMTSDGLVSKLLDSGVAEKWSDEVRFTNRFFVHVALYGEYIRSKGATVDSWREMLCALDSSLDSLDDEQVRTIVVLLDYYLEKIESNHSSRP